MKIEFNNKKFLIIENLKEKHKAIDILLRLDDFNLLLINRLYNNIITYNNKQQQVIKNLKERYNNIKIIEVNPNNRDKNTSFCINKGETIGYCIRNKKNDIHDINLLKYVSIHELAHIADNNFGHANSFYDIFYFLIKEANKFKIYKPVNYEINPKLYCGILLEHNIFFN